MRLFITMRLCGFVERCLKICGVPFVLLMKKANFFFLLPGCNIPDNTPLKNLKSCRCLCYFFTFNFLHAVKRNICEISVQEEAEWRE